MNFIVSIVYKKHDNYELASGMMEAESVAEAIIKAARLETELGSIVLQYAIICDETKASLFEDSLINRESINNQ